VRGAAASSAQEGSGEDAEMDQGGHEGVDMDLGGPMDDEESAASEKENAAPMAGMAGLVAAIPRPAPPHPRPRPRCRPARPSPCCCMAKDQNTLQARLDRRRSVTRARRRIHRLMAS
jgi:hypothetical protein